jgi:hypothetical protein
MDAAHILPTDAVELVHRLDATSIRERLDSLDRERKALLVLLRAAIRAKRRPGTGKEEHHAE